MNEDLFIKKVLKLEEDVAYIKEVMATKDDIRELKKGQDQMIGLMQRWDEERIHMNQKITELDEDVSKIKFQLKLA
jgi:hypothetical protein